MLRELESVRPVSMRYTKSSQFQECEEFREVSQTILKRLQSRQQGRIKLYQERDHPPWQPPADWLPRQKNPALARAPLPRFDSCTNPRVKRTVPTHHPRRRAHPREGPFWVASSLACDPMSYNGTRASAADQFQSTVRHPRPFQVAGVPGSSLRELHETLSNLDARAKSQAKVRKHCLKGARDGRGQNASNLKLPQIGAHCSASVIDKGDAQIAVHRARIKPRIKPTRKKTAWYKL